MIPASTRLCPACAVPNPIEATDCGTCGTLLPAVMLDGGGTAAPLGEAAAFDPFDGSTAGERAWSDVSGVAWLFMAMVAVSIMNFIAVKAGAESAQVDLVLTLAEAVVVLGCVVAVRQTVAPLLATGGGWRGAGAAVVGFAGLMAFGAVYFPAVELLGFPLMRVTDSYLEAGWPIWAVYAIMSAAPGVVEELAFRGYMMARLQRWLTPTEVLLVQAALFAVLHFGVVIFPSHFVMGLVFGLLRQRTGSLYPGMAVHAAWNAYIVWGELAT